MAAQRGEEDVAGQLLVPQEAGEAVDGEIVQGVSQELPWLQGI